LGAGVEAYDQRLLPLLDRNLGAMTPDTKTFTVSPIMGENTGKIYQGDFVVLKYLSSRQHFLQDQIYRRYLGGGDPAFAAPEVKARAQFLSEINAFCASTPEWWAKADGGMDIPDNNVVGSVYELLVTTMSELADERAAKVKESAEKLRAVVEKAEAKTAEGK
jgi:hypothetical protein